MTSRSIVFVVAAFVVAISSSVPVRTATCAGGPVEARGEQSRYVWLAKTKARANWRSKVRRTPGLGTKYAVWTLAQDADERCLTGPAGTVCIFTGIPCMP